MARIKKYGLTYAQPLSAYATFIKDTAPNSQYFRITEFKETFTGGKNGFLIEGCEHLSQATEVQIQVLDVAGNALYVEVGNGIPEYYEGTSKIISVYVYEDTPAGPATITILGQLKTYLDEGGVVRNIPDEWKNNYNIKWQKSFNINTLLRNEDKVRFYRRPKVDITEIVKPIFSAGFSNVTNTGLVSGTPVSPRTGEYLSDYKQPASYRLKTTNSAFTGSMEGNLINVTSLAYSPVISEVINKNEIIVTQPYVDSFGVVLPFTDRAYTSTFSYIEGASNIASALTGSFAKIKLTDLTAFVGDVARVRIFRKSQSDVTDYQFVQEVVLETNELLLDLETTNKNQETYGIFTQDIIKDYWVTSSNSISAQFNQNYLFNSVKLDSSTPNYFYTTKSLAITKDAEYNLSFNVRLTENIAPGNYIKAFLSGSKQSTNGTVQVKQAITTVSSTNNVLQKSTNTDNIIAEEIDNARLYFEVKGNGWHVANVSFVAAQETSFSPDEITFIQPVPRTLPEETFKYRFEFYDINNNYIPVLVEETKTFDGGNLQRLQKGLVFNPKYLYFTFDSGSNPVEPTVVGFSVTKNLLTGSVTYTSQSFDFFGDELFGSDYTASFTGQQYPGRLDDITSDNPTLRVANFTGSRSDKNIQLIKIKGECEGFEDTVIISKVLDGFGGVNHIIRPYRGVDIRNSSTQSLEVQAVRIDGINEIILNSSAVKNWGNIQLHVLSASLNPVLEPERFVNLMYVTQSNFIKGVTTGSLGSKQINYNATFNRDSIDKRLTLYLMPSSSAAGVPAYIASSSVLTSIVLSDFQDGLDSGFVAYDTDVFNINFRDSLNFIPAIANVTGSFFVRGRNTDPLTSSLSVYPSMSINKDFVPEYWVYYVTHSSTWNRDISVVAIDDDNNPIISQAPNSAYGNYVRSPLNQSKTLTITYTYTEPYTSASVSVDKTFTIVPAGKPGDESIVFEINPVSVNLKSNPKGIVNSYDPSRTEIKLKQGSRYLKFDKTRTPGTFYTASTSISTGMGVYSPYWVTGSNIITGSVVDTIPLGGGYENTLLISNASNFNNLSGSILYNLEIQPYYTSSVYTASIIQNYTKTLDGPPPIEVIISPAATAIQADEVGFVSPAGYAGANTTIKVREGNDYLTLTTQSMAPGTFRIQTGGSVIPSNIMVETITSSSRDTGIVKFNRFDYPYVSSSIQYNVVVNPYSLTNGHVYTSSVIERTQTITKNVAPPNARAVALEATTNTVNFDGDGVITSPLDPITLTATATNTTGAVWFNFYKNDDTNTGTGPTPIPEVSAGSKTATYEIEGSDAVDPGENAKWSVIIRDGNSSPSAPIRATNSLTITGIKNGPTAYNVQLTNENCSVIYKVSGQLSVVGSGTQVKATKGDVPLLHKTAVVDGGPGFSPKTTDQFGNDIGSLGEYQVSVFSVSNHLTLGDSVEALDTLPTFNDIATIGDLAGWATPETYPIAEIVYEVNIENGRLILYKTQSLSINFEGATGPGIVMRGEWKNTTDYSGSVETQNKRRDAVIYGTSPVTYYAAVSGSGPTTYNKQGTLVNYHAPTAGGDNAWWQYLGQEEFFVAAKIAIFEESFVKNTINVGNNIGSAFANIVLAGGRNDPYMAIGQYSNIGYNQSGIWLGIYDLGAGAYMPRFSLLDTAGTSYLKWSGTGLQMAGDLEIVAGATGNASTKAFASGSAGTALTSAENIAQLKSTFAYSASLSRTKELADGAFPGTFISSNFIYSPIVAGVDGYFSSTFKVGQNGITLDGGAKKIYIGTGTYKNSNTSFYVDNNSQFSLGDRLYFDGTNLTIAGKVTADSGNIGGWVIDGNNLRDENSNIILNPTVPAIEIYDNSDVKRLDIRKGILSSPSAGTTITITPPQFDDEFGASMYYYNTWPGLEEYRSVAYNTLTVSTSGTYINATPSWGVSNTLELEAGPSNYIGDISVDIYIEIHNSSTPGVGTLVQMFKIGQGSTLTTSGQTVGITNVNTSRTLYFTAGTYYVFTTVQSMGSIDFSTNPSISRAELTGTTFTPSAVTLTTALDQTELTDEGLFVIQDINKYAKISRESTTDFITVSQNSATYAAINATNFLGKGNPAITLTKGDLKVLDGRIEFNQPGVDRGFSVNWTKGAPSNYEGQLGQVLDAGQLRPSIRFNNIAGAGAIGGTMRGVEISIANGWIGRNTSSRRFKEDIEIWQHPSVLDIINSVDVKTFYWKVDAEKEYRPQNIGLIAEELLEAGLEEYVGFDTDRDENGVDKLNPDGSKAMLPYDIDKTGLVFPLWRAVQELSKKIKDLEDKINELNS
jgi:hypothetical protein